MTSCEEEESCRGDESELLLSAQRLHLHLLLRRLRAISDLPPINKLQRKPPPRILCPLRSLGFMLLKAPIHIYRDPGIEGPIPTTNEVKEPDSFGHSPNWTESPLKARPCSNTTDQLPVSLKVNGREQ